MKYVVVAMGAALLFGAGTALAGEGSDAYTNMSTKMYAGPSDQYPAVMRLSAGRPMTVYGCLENMSWCDVSWRGNRGWIAGPAVEVPKGNHRVVVSDTGAGVPTTKFILRSYWDENYRERPWYADRAKWFEAYARGVFDVAAADPVQTVEYNVGTQTASIPAE